RELVGYVDPIAILLDFPAYRMRGRIHVLSSVQEVPGCRRMTGIIVTVLTSKIGRYAILIGLSTLIVGAVILRIYNAGRKAEQMRQVQQSLENMRTRIAIDDEVSSLDTAGRRERLNRWVRGD